MTDLLEKYKSHIKENQLEGEIYKWELLTKFKGKPNPEAEDLESELKSIDFANLIYHNGKNAIYHVARDKKEEYRECLKMLFNEGIDLSERVVRFDQETKRLYRELVPNKYYSHHQDERTIATFLTYHNPQKYTFYKNSFYRKLCNFLERQHKKKGQKYVHYLELVDECINEYIIKDQELLNLISSIIPKDHFQDENHMILAQDILYQTLEKNVGQKRNYWRIGTRIEKELFWNEMKQNSIIGIGWKAIGDLADHDINSSKDIKKLLTDTNHFEDDKANLTKKANEIYEFYDAISEGDIILSQDGQKILGIGIANDAGYNFNDDKEFAHQIGVNWINKEVDFQNKVGLQTTVKRINDQKIIERVDNYIENTKDVDQNRSEIPLNQILFGPPGTGKTYSVIDKAVSIAQPDKFEKGNHKANKTVYDNLVRKGQIVFTTFHQSMSYEDFIEGIKPIKPQPDDNYLKYDIHTGLFYKISEEAKSNYEHSKKGNADKLKFETAFNKLMEELEENPDLRFPLKTKGNDFTIIGFTNTSIQFKKASGGTGHTLSISTLRDLYYNNKNFNINTGIGIYYPALVNKLTSYKGNEKSTHNKYVLVIDEINRGNVSQIFGELITLLEEDKRIDSSEMLEVELPYSKEKFSVPPNLYIIGTMNTADRSVEALDTALRRRFSFEEMPPRPELLKLENILKHLWYQHSDSKWTDPKWVKEEKAILKFFRGEILNEEKYIKLEEDDNPAWKEENPFQDIVSFQPEIKLDELLVTINKRIEKLIDKDHKIGHAYFLNVRSEEDLKLVFKDKIIPLLEEYFFGDFGKIGLVLGDSFVEKESEENFEFAAFNGYDEYLKEDLKKRNTYKIKDSNLWQFNSIYEAVQK